jgi:uncharacterized protein (TIRG00374 family)
LVGDRVKYLGYGETTRNSLGRLMQMRNRARLNFTIRTALSGLLIGGLIYHIGSSAIIDEMQSVRWQILALVIALLAGHVLIVTPRWASILRALGYRISSFTLVGSVFLGFLFNQLLPTAVGGDVIRAWRARQLGVPWSVAIHSVLFDRASAVLVVFVGASLLLPFAEPVAIHGGPLWIVGAAAAAVLIFLAVILILRRLNFGIPQLIAVQSAIVSLNWIYEQLTPFCTPRDREGDLIAPNLCGEPAIGSW